MEDVQFALSHGAKFPFDAPDVWWDSDDKPPPIADDWAHAAVRGVIANLQDRRGIKRGFDNIDEDIRVELVRTLAAIVRAAAAQAPTP